MQKKTIMSGLSTQMRIKTNIAKNRIEYEEKTNVYGFKKELLSSPTSVSMLNSAMVKNANVNRMDTLFSQMKKRKSIIPTFQTQNSVQTLSGGSSMG
mmetsp:Transcript_39406/g.60235  ORF Transcript_39406/g.60235 Transcript_39406/m.60235 type:complete len:97 (+) Transcript_39406:2205-2495(+)